MVKIVITLHRRISKPPCPQNKFAKRIWQFKGACMKLHLWKVKWKEENYQHKSPARFTDIVQFFL